MYFLEDIAISFTNKASDELKRRCKQRCKDTKQSFFGTIDKFYLSQIIMPFACHITGVKKDYEVIEDIPEEGKYSSLLQYDSVLTQLQKDLLIYGLYDGIVFLKYIGETALEFNIVFHMDMYKWVLSNEYGNEEEKQQNLNLHYVGVTRAIDVCYIMLGSKRYNSKGKCYDALPSSFLEKQELTYRRVDVKW